MEVYNDIKDGLMTCLTEEETLWFIWNKVANIVHGANECAKGDIMGTMMHEYQWDPSLPYWCWDFIKLFDDNRFKDDFDASYRKAQHRYRSIVNDLSEPDATGNIGPKWQQIIGEKDRAVISRLATGLDLLADKMLPSILRKICTTLSSWDSKSIKYIDDNSKMKMERLTKIECEKTKQLATSLRESIV